jgi:hypothetical protein
MKLKLLLLSCVLLLAAAHAGRVPRRYKVELAYTGYLSVSPIPECLDLMNVNGYDSLIGTVQGDEPTAATDDDMVYTGRVKRKTDIDSCLTRPKSAATPDELVWCKATLKGSAEMDIEITVHFDAGTGAYVHAKPVVGSGQNLGWNDGCQTAESSELRSEYPGGASLASPDGQPIVDPAGSSFVLNDIPRLRRGYSPPKPPLTAWGMRVTPLP